MHRSESYQADAAEVEAFVRSMRHGYLTAAGTRGFPSVSILPFLKAGETIELHCVRADPTFVALQADPRVTFLVSDFLAASPHQWVDPNDAGRATLHFRAVQYSCEARWSTNPADVAAILRRMVDAYDGSGAYQPIEDGSFYGPRLARLAMIRLRIIETEAKFKAGPAGDVNTRIRLAEHLRERAAPGDLRAADVIEQRARQLAAG
ncbi:MAG: FMN-binding negative transcriptional regulator [Dehalococcoidia bacterium]